VFAVQFHPESILSTQAVTGQKLVENLLQELHRKRNEAGAMQRRVNG
jgi:gamma-glutamyl-gamma-aminobutyrate hydrolase PuuD